MNDYVLYLIIALALSFLVNVFLIWYARNASSRLTVVASNIDEIMTVLSNFENHLETIYEMETYYGDETLYAILRHAKAMADFLSGFTDIYELAEELPEQTEEEREEYYDRKEADTFGAKAQEEKKKTTKKVVFHSGT
tara:strand:- start:374 stop:787 length:414 start_codon:yes stop_codon:yes gene_type:complete